MRHLHDECSEHLLETAHALAQAAGARVRRAAARAAVAQQHARARPAELRAELARPARLDAAAWRYLAAARRRAVAGSGSATRLISAQNRCMWVWFICSSCTAQLPAASDLRVCPRHEGLVKTGLSLLVLKPERAAITPAGAGGVLCGEGRKRTACQTAQPHSGCLVLDLGVRACGWLPCSCPLLELPAAILGSFHKSSPCVSCLELNLA